LLASIITPVTPNNRGRRERGHWRKPGTSVILGHDREV